MTQKEIDLELEKQFSNYLDCCIYPKIMKFKYKRIDYLSKGGKEKQLKGVDLIGNKNKNIDEKAQLSYIQKSLNTFAFELSFINRSGVKTIGWLIDDKMETDYYFLGRNIQVNIDSIKSEHEIKKIRSEIISRIKNNEMIPFSSCYIDSLKRIKLKEELNKIELTKEKLLFYVDSIRKSTNIKALKNIRGVKSVEAVRSKNKISQIKIEINEIEKSKGMIYLSTYLIEKPINLVLKDSFLKMCEIRRLWPLRT